MSASATAKESILWEPQPGPQSALITCPADDIFLGGARGGGKSDGVIGDWLIHSGTHGKHTGGIVIRRDTVQLEELIARSQELFFKLGAKWHEQKKWWVMPGGGRLKFRYLENDRDAMHYQGHSYCVAVGTRILMANGELRQIERVLVGESVATLVGPRRVLALTPPYVAPCVEAVVRDNSGWVVGRQCHPVWHPVLTSAGLIWSGSAHGLGIDELSQFSKCVSDTRDQESSRGIYPALPAWLSWREGIRSDCRESLCSLEESLRPGSWFCPVVLHAPSVQSAIGQSRAGRKVSTKSHAPSKLSVPSSAKRLGWRDFDWDRRRLGARVQSILGHFSHALSNARAYVLHDWLIIRDSYLNYLFYFGFCDVRFRVEKGIAQECIPSQADVEKPRPARLLDESGTTPLHSRKRPRSWVHPYTGAEVGLPEAVILGTMECHFVGESWVADLCVEGANHYIGESGLINKNTRLYPEEMTNFPNPGPIDKMRATLRSPYGIPCKLIGTGNPGGPGHQWVKERYISPNPLGYQLFKIQLPKGKSITRCFIPAKLSDNLFLNRADYEANLHLVGSDALVKAWLEGDWNAVEGAYFDCWSSRMVLAPFTIPKHWTRFMSFDWGSARPFSVDWWAIAEAEAVETMAGPIQLPQGAMVHYRELYGCSRRPDGIRIPNVGLKWDAEQIAAAIWKMEALDEKIAYRVAGHDVFDRSKGPSISEVMFKFIPENRKGTQNVGLLWRKADIKRVPGWSMLRLRMNGFDGVPMIYTFGTCVDSIDTIPALQHDAAKPEDLDCWVAGTLVATPLGDKPIETIAVGDLVDTPIGPRRVLRSYLSGVGETIWAELADGRILAGTSRHKVFVRGRGLVPLGLLQCHDILTERITWSRWLYIAALFIDAIRGVFTTIQTVQSWLRVARAFIVKYGLMPVKLFFMVGIFTIAMKTMITMKSATLNVYHMGSTPKCTFGSGFQEHLANNSLNGDVQRKAKKYLGQTQRKCVTAYRDAQLRVSIVTVLLAHGILENVFVRIVARSFMGLRKLNALFATFHSVEKHIRQEQCKPVHIVAVGRCVEKTQVYNLTVDEAHLFYANGILSSNTEAEDHCADSWRYASMSRPMSLVRPKELRKLVNPYTMDAMGPVVVKPQPQYTRYDVM